MTVRTRLGRRLEATLGKARTDHLRAVERHARQHASDLLAPRRPPSVRPVSESGVVVKPGSGADLGRRPLGEPNDRQGGWIPSDPFVPHPKPTMTRHDLLRGLHQVLQPRTYLEIGVNEGASLTLSSARSIGVDPEFTVRHPLHCDLDLVQAKSDDYFSRPDALAHFAGVPVDLAFIDGMHLSEFAVRDFINVEAHLAPGAVTVFDDVLPRNGLEAARVRQTGAWAGDVYKAVEMIARHRRDLLVIMINTWPTGTAVVIGGVPGSDVLTRAYEHELGYLRAPDPQRPPPAYLSRSIAVDPAALLASPAWALLIEARESEDDGLLGRARSLLRAVPTLG